MTTTNTTVGALVDATLEHLLGSAREEMNRLTANIGTSDTSLTVDFPVAGMGRGTYIGIDDEVMYVWGPGVGSQQVVIQRGMKGTTAATHTSGALVKVNPYFTRPQVRQALKDDIRSWGPQVWAVRTVEVSAVNGVRGYDLGNIAPFYYGLELRISPDTSTGASSDDAWPVVEHWEVVHSAPVSQYPSGSALIVKEQIGWTAPRTFHLVYAAPFDVDDAFDDTTDLLSAVGVDISDFDIAPYGAAWRMVGFREVRRTLIEAQGQPSDLSTAPPMYAARSADWLKQQRDSRLNDAMIRLRSLYPVRKG